MEAIAQELFKSWFIDFDPVYAKGSGGKSPGLDATTAGLFPSQLVDSAFGPIPKGWRAAAVPEAFEIKPQLAPLARAKSHHISKCPTCRHLQCALWRGKNASMAQVCGLSMVRSSRRSPQISFCHSAGANRSAIRRIRCANACAY